MSGFPGPDDPARWDLAIEIMQRGGDYAHTALLEAGKAGLLDLVYVSDRKASLPFGKIRKATAPVLVLIGDDDEDPSGPDGWRCARPITQWARGSIVHGAGAKREHYELAVIGTQACRRFLVIDTASRHIAAWAELLTHAQPLLIVPTDGVHPRPQPRETVH